MMIIEEYTPVPNTAFDFKIPDLIEMQLSSFRIFLKKGLIEELKDFSVISNSKKNLELRFFPEKYKLKRPKYNERTSIRRASTYTCQLYVPAKLTNKRTGEIQEQDVFLGEIPLMTGRGSFIINGSSRVIVNQIVRSPGIYYKREIDKKGRKTHSATIISNRGAWLRIETDKNGLIWARIGKIRKVSIMIVFKAMGLTKNEIFDALKYPQFLKKTIQETDPYLEHDIQHDDDFENESTSTLLSTREILESRFFQSKYYDLGKVGRYKINKKLQLNVPENIRVLTVQDILAAVDYLINLEFNIGTLDDIDHLKNRRVRSVGELIQNQVRVGLGRLERMIYKRMGESSPDSLTLTSLVNPKPLVGAIREFFGSSQLSQFMDQTNPLSEITHKRRLSCLGPGGLSRERAGLAVRDIHPSHYGRICPIETPEGPNAGLIGSLATHSRVNEYGFLESPFYITKNRKVIKSELPIYLAPDQEDQFKVAPGDLLLSCYSSIENTYVPVRYKQEFTTSKAEEVDYVGISPTQAISIATSLIPFLEHDDANRALMGSNMQRQAVPLLKPNRPIVGTGFEEQVALDSGTVVICRHKGIVISVDSKTILVRSLRMNSKGIQHSHIDRYYLQKYNRSNQDTCINQKPVVSQGEWVQKGDILADGSATVNGELTLGQNILVAYMPWEGYNFEDAILISEKLVYEDIYTSIHIEKYEVDARKTKLGPEKITREIPNVNDHLLRNLDDNGIVIPGARVESGDILVGKVTPKEDLDQHPEGKLLRAIFGEKARDVRDSSLRVPNGVSGTVVNVRRLTGKELPSGVIMMVHVSISQKRKIQVGDKMAGRHGNKGIISKILPRQDMPYLQDGTPVDMVLNPLGVPSRMNVGQVFECLLGLAGEYLSENYKLMPFDEMYGKETSRGLVYSKLYEASKKTGYPWLFNIQSPGKSKLFDGRTGEPFDQPVTIGKAYMLKLVHLVDDKIHARSTGPYSLVTQQPLGGRAKHGGQRLGEMEVWALEGFGAAYTLQELLTIKSDDMKGRNDALNAIIKGRPIPKPGTPESFKVLIRELQSLCLDIGVYKVHKSNKNQEIDLMQNF